MSDYKNLRLFIRLERITNGSILTIPIGNVPRSREEGVEMCEKFFAENYDYPWVIDGFGVGSPGKGDNFGLMDEPETE